MTGFQRKYFYGYFFTDEDTDSQTNPHEDSREKVKSNEKIETKEVQEDSEISEFLCAVCSEGFSQKNRLYWHILSVHDTETVDHQCQICNSCFTDEESLKNHISLGSYN